MGFCRHHILHVLEWSHTPSHLQHCHCRLLPVHEARLDVPGRAPVVHAGGVVLHLGLLYAVYVDRGRRAGLVVAGVPGGEAGPGHVEAM